jgi:hypothetical protein
MLFVQGRTTHERSDILITKPSTTKSEKLPRRDRAVLGRWQDRRDKSRHCCELVVTFSWNELDRYRQKENLMPGRMFERGGFLVQEMGREEYGSCVDVVVKEDKPSTFSGMRYSFTADAGELLAERL